MQLPTGVCTEAPCKNMRDQLQQQQEDRRDGQTMRVAMNTEWLATLRGKHGREE